MELIFLKLGGSLITNKRRPFVSRKSIIRRLSVEIKNGLGGSNLRLVIAHGSGSFGHSAAAKYRTQDGVINKSSIMGISKVSDAAIRINRIVMKELLGVGLPVISFAPKSFIWTNSGKTKQMLTAPIVKSLNLGLIPVVYGDVIIDEEKGSCIFSSETIITELARELRHGFKIKRVIYCGITAGVYGLSGKTIPIIKPDSLRKLNRVLGSSGGIDVTGGMVHKVHEAIRVVKEAKCNVHIIDGTKTGNLQKAIAGKEVLGTVVTLTHLPRERK